MKKLFILPFILLMSCGNNVKSDTQAEAKAQYVKSITVDDMTYDVVRASDSCEYYRMRIEADYSTYIRHFHYPQCSYCKTHK